MKTNRYGSLTAAFALVAGLALAAPAPAGAQDGDARWTPFLGCWEPTGEAAPEGVLCVRPSGEGVELFTVVGGEQATSDIMIADGAERSRSIEGCEGWEAAQFSELGRRVFTRSEFTCAESTARAATGIMSLVTPTRWIDVRSVDVDGENVAWVQEYRLAGPEVARAAGVVDVTADRGMAIRTARMSAARSIDVWDVEEALEQVDAEAVEAWVVARGDEFDLDADELIRLDDAGVPANVIDVMVAMSYPERFQVSAEPGDIDQMADAYDRRGDRYAYGSACFGMRRSLFWDPLYYGACYSPYGYRYGGFGYYGYGRPYYGYGGYGTIIITERTGSSGPRGRVVNGRGYTQSGGSSNAGARPSQGGGSSAAPPSSSGGSSTGRTAKPRGGRDGGDSGGGGETTPVRMAKPRGGR